MEDKTPSPPPILFNLSPEVKAALEKFFIKNKGTIPHSHSYFNERYGIKVKEIVDDILLNRKPIKIPIENDYTVHALRQQWYEGAKYLRQHLDTPEGKYTQALNYIKCHTEYDYIELRPRASLRGALLNVQTAPTNNEWRAEMMEYLDSNPPLESKFQPTSEVLLADSDIEWANNQMIGIEKLFLYKFERNKVLIIRMNQDG